MQSGGIIGGEEPDAVSNKSTNDCSNRSLPICALPIKTKYNRDPENNTGRAKIKHLEYHDCAVAIDQC